MKKSSVLPSAVLVGMAVLASSAALAKLPPLSDEAKARAAEAAARTAHGNKVANYQLCVSMDRVAQAYFANAKTAGKDVKPALSTPPCENPGAFVYTPPAASPAPAVAAAATPAPAPTPARP